MQNQICVVGKVQMSNTDFPIVPLCRLLLKAGWWPLGRVITLLAPRISRPGRVIWLASGQGDGATKTAHFGSKICFLNQRFHWELMTSLVVSSKPFSETINKEQVSLLSLNRPSLWVLALWPYAGQAWADSFWINIIIVLKRISARNLKNMLKQSRGIVFIWETRIFYKNVCKKGKCVFLGGLSCLISGEKCWSINLLIFFELINYIN